ncbi:MAG: hypothetical protein AB1695_11735 [Stygiobacter sp.]|uniref:Uncharacterized protein n=1 Tax=Stygiobacter electus TaxID=3032292 RepID=A0AAE3NWZ6_9BACT|nr:hypothetical protein [Stygiobacter electus]MDF1611601.1 hypothetical protein [Stygiobacter electus]
MNVKIEKLSNRLEATCWVFSSIKFVVKIGFESINETSDLTLLLSILLASVLLSEKRNSPTIKSKKKYVNVIDFKISLKFSMQI